MGQKVNPHGFRVGVIYDWDGQFSPKRDKESENPEEIDDADSSTD